MSAVKWAFAVVALLIGAALARVTYLTGEAWHSTSTLYNQYRTILAKDTKPLGYRRVSELLTKLENTGLVISQTSSKGRHGFGTQYKLIVPPDTVGNVIDQEWWKSVVKAKLEHDEKIKREKMMPKVDKSSSLGGLYGMLKSKSDEDWQEFVGL